MANKMLIDAAHPEETRVVVLRGNRVEDFDFEAADKKQLRGNIYLAKVTRVEPSLQAAFIDYGGNRHGFLAFSEIHPDYYQIPVADRQALLEDEAQAHEDEEEESRTPRRSRRHRRDRNGGNGGRAEKRRAPGDDTVSEAEETAAPTGESDEAEPIGATTGETETPVLASTDESGGTIELAPGTDATSVGTAAAEPVADQDAAAPERAEAYDATASTDEGATAPAAHDEQPAPVSAEATPADVESGEDDEADGEDAEAEHVEQLGGDDMEEVQRRMPRMRKQYKIQEVIKRRQVLLVQVVKEERGNKGAALTTYLSLAGRYSVLMPNTARGGGISRKITDSSDRSRLKAIAQELEVPEGMGVILRTAGASRTKQEVRRDFEYLLRMWETVRETTLKSTAPTLTYEEGSLIKRSIRDLYNKDIDDIVVAGEGGYREAREFMRLLMPTHTRAVQAYRDPQPLFAKHGVEAQLDAMFSAQVTLKSGGYIVINQTEALVAIDVNSGRSTREHDIEDTALRTNLEAADEVGRQLRLRDLAGLIVVDFIDMDENRNNRSVERRLKDALKEDRARIQVGRISHFGLLEMSRQRMRTGVFEGSTVPCPHCAGAGMVRSTASIALHVLRLLEDSLIKSATHNLVLRTRVAVALYVLNQKRLHLRDLEARFGVVITVAVDETLTGTTYHAIDRGEPASGIVEAPRQAPVAYADFADDEPIDETGAEDDESGEAAAGDETTGAQGADGPDGDGRRRRRRRRRGRDRESSGIEPNAPQPSDDALSALSVEGGPPPVAGEDAGDGEAGDGEDAGPGDDRLPRTRRRRSRRGGRGGARDEQNPSVAATDDTDEGMAADTPLAAADAGAIQPAVTEVLPPMQAGTPEAAASIPPILTEPPPAAPTEPEPVAAATPSSAPAEAPDDELDPSRPKRTGWWQRAKATLRG